MGACREDISVNKPLLIGAGILVVLVLSVPLLASLKTGAGGGGGAASSAESGSAAGTGAASGSTAPAALQPPLLTAENLVGSAWTMSGYQVSLGAGGVATANTPFGQVSGTWSVNGSTLTISAMGRTENAQISGDQILVGGQPATRVQ